MKKLQGWFVQFCSILAFVLVFCGCGGASYEIIASSSGFPTSAQMERDRVILAIPKDLREKLEAVVRESNASAELGGNRQFFAQMPNPKVLLQKKLLETVLGWAGQKPPDERLNEQTQRMQQPTNELTIDDPRVQYGAGVASGAAIGTVPFGPFAADVAIELKVLPKGTYYARVGRCAGELVSGVIQMAVGCSGMATGIGLTGTGGGAPAGIVVISGSFAVALNGSVTAGHALDEAQRLWNEGAPPETPVPAPQEQLLQPKTKPQTAPPVQAASAAKPVQQAAPAPVTPSKTVTRNKKTGELVSTSTTSPAGTTRTVAKPKQAPAQVAAEVKPKAPEAPTTVQAGADVKPKAITPYAQPSGATTPAQRAVVQGKPCVNCGTVAPRQVADHKTPLVKEHYETGAIDKNRMRTADAVQPQCPTCSARQGAEMSQYSRKQRQRLKGSVP